MEIHAQARYDADEQLVLERRRGREVVSGAAEIGGSRQAVAD
jgi:hypothetical protein